MTVNTIQIGNRTCRLYGENQPEYLLIQMADEHELQRMDNEVAAIAQDAPHPFLFAAVPVTDWNGELSPWETPAIGGKECFGGKATETLQFLTEQLIPTLRRQMAPAQDTKIVLGGYSLAGLFALWASTQTQLFYAVAAASPSVWYPGWPEYEQQHPIRAQRIYLSLGDREEYTKNRTMAAVGENIRALQRTLAARGKVSVLEWNHGGHFKEADRRTARAFCRAMGESV